MFDDQINPNLGGSVPPRPNQPVTPPPAAPYAPPVPPMASFKEPEDIFTDVDANELAVKGPAQPVARPGVPLAALPPLGQPTPVRPVMPPPRPMLPEEEKSPLLGRILKIAVLVIIVLAALAGLAVAGWYGYTRFFGAAIPVTPAANANAGVNTGQPVNINVPLNPAPPSDPGTVVNVNLPPTPPPDTDRDGLTDAEELLYGTNINVADTDADGLTDRDEIKIFKTDPKNSDSDGDKYLDGEEVQHGYDPKGPGKLLKIE